MSQLQQVNPIHLSGLWDGIKQGIEEILEGLNKETLQELWIPEDVYTSIRVGESILLLSDDGFVIVQLKNDRFTGQKQFFVWLAYTFDSSRNIMEETQPFLEGLARHWGCEMMQFSSNRPGFRKKAIEMGYSNGPTIYSKRV
jgi:hypothetical protein